jgi:hypothetical protein
MTVDAIEAESLVKTYPGNAPCSAHVVAERGDD